MLSGGKSTSQIPPDPFREVGLSQVFVAFDPKGLPDSDNKDQLADAVIQHLHGSTPVNRAGRVRYPGERVLAVRKQNLEEGVPVDPKVWAAVKSM